MRRTLAVAVYVTVLRWLPQSTMPGGAVWKGARAWAARHMLDGCGRSVNVEHGAWFGSGEGIRLGDRSGIGVNCRLHGPVHIGDHVMMGPDVVILGRQHSFDDLETPMIDQGHAPVAPVIIGDDVWIGTRAIILPGVTVGCHAVIGAGAVVTRAVSAWSVVAGNPAQTLRSRASGAD